MEPKVSHTCQAARPGGGWHARRIGGYAGNMKFLQQIITLVLEPTSMAWFPYNVS
jgi:hypothetical protein